MYLLCTDFRKAALGPTRDLHLPSTSIDDTSSVLLRRKTCGRPHAGMPVSVRLSLSRGRAMASSSTSWLSGAADRRIEATNEKAAKEKARREAIGVLKKRPATIPRKAGELDAIVARYLIARVAASVPQRPRKSEHSSSYFLQEGLIFTETCRKDVLLRHPYLFPCLIQNF